MRKLIVVSLVLCASLLGAVSAQAAPAVNGVFDLPEQANRIAQGPDGNIWVTLQTASPNIVRIGPDGTVTPFTTGAFGTAVGITAGPDGNMWVTGINFVGKFSPADPTVDTEYTIGTIGTPNEIITGPDGNLWTASQGNVYKISTAAPATPTVIPSNVTNFTARGIAASTDGKIWVANGEMTTPGVLPVTLAGVAGTQVNVTTPGGVQDVATGPAGQAVYTNPIANPQQIGLINGGIAATPFTFPAPGDPFGVTLGQDGAYWIAQVSPAAIGRYTTGGVYAKFADLPVDSKPRRITKGPNGTMWVILGRDGELFSRVARVTGIEPPANGDTTPPAISKTSLTNKRFKVGATKTAVSAKKKKVTPTGTTIKFTLSENATVSIAVEKSAAGKKSGKKCVKPTKALKKAKKCTRYVKVKTLTRTSLKGANNVAFSGRIGNKKLAPGKYRFSISAKDLAGNTSAPLTKSFVIVKK